MVTLTIDFNELPLPKAKRLISVLGGKTRIEVLEKINQNKNWTITKLAKEMDCTVGNLSQQVSDLEKAHLVIRKRSPTIGSNIKIIKPVYDEVVIRF